MYGFTYMKRCEMYKENPLMSTIFSRLGFLVILMSILGMVELKAQPLPEVIPGKFIVKVRTGITLPKNLNNTKTGVPALDEALKSFPVRTVKPFCPKSVINDPKGLSRVLELTLDPNIDAEQLVTRLHSLGDIEYAEPRYRRTVKSKCGVDSPQSTPTNATCREVASQVLGSDELPNDPYFPLQWWLSYINTPAAWDIEIGDSTVIIANVDLGVDIDHPDLAPLVWRNPEENGGVSGVDDDGNGWIDDIYGWDFVDNDPDPRPEDGDYHGTHTSGIALAATNNGIGGAGVARNCRLMSVRAGNGNEIYYGYEGIYYAAHTGAKIISLSWGGYGFSQFEQDVVEDAQAMGCLLVGAAGNEALSSEHYPSAYDAVIGVAALDQSGQKADFSNWGIWVDIAAPGVAIFSTMPNNQWDYLSGTSMAAPVVAGVGALAASLHPEYNGQQLMAAVIASGNPIDDINPVYGSRLGTGCVDAFRAVDGGRGGLVLDSIYFDDSIGGNGDGIPDSGESIRLSVWLRNELADETYVTGYLIEEEAGILPQISTSNFGVAPANSVVNNDGNPFEFNLTSGLSPNVRMRIALELQDGNGRRLRRIPIQFVISPSYADHDIGNVRFTITDFGAFGYLEYLAAENGEPRGSGFCYPKDGMSWLYHGSWIIGSDSNHVSDNCFGDVNFSRKDFQVVPGGELTISSPGISDQDGYAIFNDATATNPMGIRVTQRSYAWASPPDDDYVIVEVTVENQNTTTLSNLYVGLFLDWDVAVYVQNRGGWEATSGVGWMRNPYFPSPYVGLALMEGNPASFRVIKNSQVIYNQGFPDSTKYRYLRQGIVTDLGSTDDDWSVLESAGPYVLNPGQSVTVAYAVGAGDSLSDLTQNLESARIQYQQIVLNSIRKPVPAEVLAWELMAPYPNPYNDLTRISLISRQSGDIKLDLYNVLGQKVSTIFQGSVEVGIYHFNIQNTLLSSGTYYCRLKAPGINTIQKVTLIR